MIESNQKIIIEGINKPSTSIDNSYDIKNKKGELKVDNKSSIDSTKTKKFKIFKNR